MQKSYIISLYCSIKEIVGYEPEEFYANHERFYDFLHPAEYSDLKAMAAKSRGKSSTKYLSFDVPYLFE